MSIREKIREYKKCTDEEWNDWHWQLKNRISTVEELQQYLTLTDEEIYGIQECLKSLRMSITPYYLSLIQNNSINDPIRKQAVPTSKELFIAQEDMVDPLSEDIYSPVPGLIHKYPDRVLLLSTDQCSMYCRHCTRRRFAGQHDKPLENMEEALDYIEKKTVVRDVLISGGDALTLSDERLEYILDRLSHVKHVEVVRIGTRMPVVMPQRITDDLVAMLKKYQPLWISVQFNHPQEITKESREACEKLADNGIPLLNQSVLLRGINDCVGTMRDLVHELVRMRIRPYYLYQCDLSAGISHFRTKVSKGIQIMEGLRGYTSGFCIPTFVIDSKGGKIPVGPQYILSNNDNKVIFRSYQGVTSEYEQPSEIGEECNCTLCQEIKAKMKAYNTEGRKDGGDK
ncbi:MAG TPA: lysine 2,3-aminomutase [Lachnospiraceae bacterium]|nr:lysine 2,3-aminomutase [uncultured Lachnoclostridium sp.]HAU85586.1 lysine 2,3-aminomutase [Lachnospiraceae bacterium]